jgi:predicted metal-dependent peptidase
VQASAWSVEELGSLLIHHTGHLIRDHAGRAETMGVTPSTAERWSTAADAELNDDLADVGLTIPGQNILPEDHGWDRGRMAEEYFHLESSDEEAPQSDHGSGSHGHERELLRAQTAQQMLDAVQTGQGNVPGSWKRWAEDLLRPRVDWRRALAAEVRRGVQAVAGAVDYSYRRPSRRASTSPSIVLPSLEKPVPEVAVVCDTSGSMGGREIARVLAEVEGLLSSIGLRSGGVRVLAVDTAVNAVKRVSTARQVELVGGGGTDMGRGIEAAAALKPRPSVLVVLTDGLTPWPAEGPRGVRVVIGLLTGASPSSRLPSLPPTPHWARVVRIDDE